MENKTRTLDDLIMDSDVVVAQRARSSAELDQITRMTKQALVEAEIDLELFFAVPNSGDAILTYGTTSDVADELWDRVQDVVVSVVQEIVGLGWPHIREVSWATTGPIAGNRITTVAQIEPGGSL